MMKRVIKPSPVPQKFNQVPGHPLSHPTWPPVKHPIVVLLYCMFIVSSVDDLTNTCAPDMIRVGFSSFPFVSSSAICACSMRLSRARWSVRVTIDPFAPKTASPGAGWLIGSSCSVACQLARNFSTLYPVIAGTLTVWYAARLKKKTWRKRTRKKNTTTYPFALDTSP